MEEGIEIQGEGIRTEIGEEEEEEGAIVHLREEEWIVGKGEGEEIREGET